MRGYSKCNKRCVRGIFQRTIGIFSMVGPRPCQAVGLEVLAIASTKHVLRSVALQTYCSENALHAEWIGNHVIAWWTILTTNATWKLNLLKGLQFFQITISNARYPPVLRLAFWSNHNLAIAIAKASCDHPRCRGGARRKKKQLLDFSIYGKCDTYNKNQKMTRHRKMRKCRFPPFGFLMAEFVAESFGILCVVSFKFVIKYQNELAEDACHDLQRTGWAWWVTTSTSIVTSWPSQFSQSQSDPRGRCNKVWGVFPFLFLFYFSCLFERHFFM